VEKQVWFEGCIILGQYEIARPCKVQSEDTSMNLGDGFHDLSTSRGFHLLEQIPCSNSPLLIVLNHHFRVSILSIDIDS
jgi:hypothetical protein